MQKTPRRLLVPFLAEDWTMLSVLPLAEVQEKAALRSDSSMASFGGSPNPLWLPDNSQGDCTGEYGQI